MHNAHISVHLLPYFTILSFLGVQIKHFLVGMPSHLSPFNCLIPLSKLLKQIPILDWIRHIQSFYGLQGHPYDFFPMSLKYIYILVSHMQTYLLHMQLKRLCHSRRLNQLMSVVHNRMHAQATDYTGTARKKAQQVITRYTEKKSIPMIALCPAFSNHG